MPFPAILPLQFGVAFVHLGVPRWDRSPRLHSLGEVLCPILSGNSPEARIVHLLLAPKTPAVPVARVHIASYLIHPIDVLNREYLNARRSRVFVSSRPVPYHPSPREPLAR